MNVATSPLPVPRLFGLATVAAPVVFVAGDIAYVSAGDGVNDGVLGGTVGMWACLLFVFAWVGVARTLEAAAPRGALVLLAVGLTGFTAGAAFNADAIQRGYLGESFFNGAALEGPDVIGILAFLPWGWCAPLSFVVAGLVVWHTRTYPGWNAVLLMLGGLAFLAGRPAAIDLVVIIADSVLVLALVPIGLDMISPMRRPAAEHGLAHP